MEHYSLASLMVVVAIAFLVPILLHKLKLQTLPVVVAEIIAGLIIGRSGFNLIKEDPILELLSLLGFIYLMFLSGVEIDFSFFSAGGSKKRGKKKFFNPFIVATVIFAAILVVSYVLSWLLVQMNLADDAFLMTIIIATISLGVVVPVLKEKRMLGTELGQTLLLITVISDFITMILLAVYISWLSGSIAKMLLLLLFFVLVVGTYLVVRKWASRAIFKLLSQGTTQIGTRAVFALILLFVVLSETLGAENILGAFLAGVVVSLMAPKKEFIHRLDTFGYGFLIPIFFVMVGVKLDVWGLFTNWKVFLFIPVLLLFILVSKLIPGLVLKIWFSWKETIGSSMLIASTLSLVIAAATTASELGLIDESVYGALILVAILSCLLFPVVFNRLFPEVQAERKSVVSIVGANHVTIPVTQGLGKEGHEVNLYSTEKVDASGNALSTVEVSALNIDALEAQGAYDADVIVLGTMNDELNVMLARHASGNGLKRIIVRVEDPQLQEKAKAEGYTVFSTLFASTTLLRAIIENPSAVEFITHQDGTIQEIVVDNPKLHERQLRELPNVGNLLILRIYRGESFIIPNGNTEILLGDRLLVSGDADAIAALKGNVG